MVFLYLLEWLIIGLGILVLGTQVIIPIITNRPTFPILRWNKEDKEIKALEEELEIEKVREHKKELQEQLNQRRKQWTSTDQEPEPQDKA